MIINIKQSKPGSDIERELSILSRDTHTPSGRLIHSALRMAITKTVGYGDIYKITPKKLPHVLASQAYRELSNRAPALLDALLETAEKDSPSLEVQILVSGYEERSDLSSHQRIEAIPMLIAWFSSGT
jgi:hypothetical protein